MNELLVYGAVAAPILSAVLVLWGSRTSIVDELAAAGAGLFVLASAILLAAEVLESGPVMVHGGVFQVDALSVFLLLVIGATSLAAQVYGFGHFRRHTGVEGAGLDPDAGQKFRFLGQLFVATMVLAAIAGSLGSLWIALEGTMLASALLVGFHRQTVSLEAAWKYVIIGTVGLALALFGIVLLYIAAQHAGHSGMGALGWNRIGTMSLDPRVVKVAFVFALVGLGTVAGLAPMHMWRPDAYSAPPAPVSALLAACLAPCSLYALFRLHSVVSHAIGPDFPSMMLRGFGLTSIAVAALFVLVQRDAKRLLAFSSVEQAGLAVLGIGFGGSLAVTGAILHLMSHSLAKALLYFVVGDIEARYRTRDMMRIRGLLVEAPGTARLLVIGTAALIGLPPFLTFTSRFLILYGGFVRGHAVQACTALALSAIVVAAFVWHIGAMTLGEAAPSRRPRGAWRWGLASGTMAVLAAASLVLGVTLPGPLRTMFDRAAAALVGLP